ncbi:hypothetical protein Tco_0790157 [Tanacetum coccineum]
MIVMTSIIALESLFCHFFDESFIGENLVVSKSSVVTATDASDNRQQQQDSTSFSPTVNADGNFDFRPDLVQAVCYCARYQAKPIEKHIKEMLIMPDALILAKVRLEEYMSSEDRTQSLETMLCVSPYIHSIINIKEDDMREYISPENRPMFIKTYGELGHEHKFITEIIARRANGCIVSITEPDYKNLNKNDIEDMYLLIVNGKVEDYAETELLWSLSVFIRSTVIWERVHDFQLVYGIIYKNSKKEKRVMRHQEVHKFCDATLKKVLEGLKSYNNDVKHGYVTPSLSNEDDEYLQLFEEEIEERMKHRD